jgi:predicted alpha/beta hydrolase
VPHDQPVVRVEAVDGHRFELIDVCGRKVRHTLLILPGMGISARRYIAFSRRLADRGTRVLIHEWRGIGSSSIRASRSSNWGYHELIERDLEAGLEAAVELNEGEPVWLGGHSLGSQLCCLLAARHPSRAAGLLLIAGGAPDVRAFPWHLGLALRIIFRAIPPLASAVGYYPGKRLGFAGSEARSVMRDWARTGLTGSYDLPTLAPGYEARLAELARPVLAIRMSEDWFVPPESLESLLDRLGRGRIERVVIDAAQQGAPTDHFRWLKSPGATASAVSDWLDRRTESV